jgi:hypothetical protein
MSIQMTSGYARDMAVATEPVCLYDTTDGMAFGPTFEDREEAGAFLRWYERAHLLPLNAVNVDLAIAQEWRAHVESHPEAECPFDDESAGVGFLVDRDGADGQAWTPRCQCTCHFDKQGRVEVLGGWAE